MFSRLVAAAVFTLAADAASAQGFSDTSIGYRFGDYFREPGIADGRHPHGVNIDKNILNIGHADAWQYGSNFFNLDILKSNRRDPANNSSQGALEAYFVYRGDLSPNQIFKTNMFTFGPVRDITLQAGFDINTKNTAFAPQKDLTVIGPNIHFNTSGFFNLAVLFGKEWNNNGITNRSVSFDPQVIFSAAYSYPLDFQKFVPLRIDGFANFNSPKGRDGFGAKTQWEILSQTRLVLDLGQVVLNKPKFLDAYVGFEYWLNKFGNDHTRVPGSLAYSPLIGTAVHF